MNVATISATPKSSKKHQSCLNLNSDIANLTPSTAVTKPERYYEFNGNVSQDRRSQKLLETLNHPQMSNGVLKKGLSLSKSSFDQGLLDDTPYERARVGSIGARSNESNPYNFVNIE